MADILHEEIFSSLNFRVQSCPRGGEGQLPPPLLLQYLHHCVYVLFSLVRGVGHIRARKDCWAYGSLSEQQVDRSGY